MINSLLLFGQSIDPGAAGLWQSFVQITVLSFHKNTLTAQFGQIQDTEVCCDK